MDEGLISYLSGFITANRIKTFGKVLKNRTKYITVVLEDIYQSHNASAVLRSCDCFGIQDIHIIENQNEYTINPDVTLGANKWLNICRYNRQENNTLPAIQTLKSSGYRIIATTPHKKKHTNLDDLDLKKGKVALIFGSELNGFSEDVFNHADEFLKIPMFGFTESFNISVSAGIVLYHLTSKLHKLDIQWQLNDEEKQEIYLMWLRKTIKHPEMLEKEYFRSISDIKK